MRLTSPLHLTADTVIESNASGGVNAIALKNPIGGPMQVHQIKFQLTATLLSGQDSGALGSLGGVIGASISIGNHPLTNGFVPVWLFGRPNNVVNGGEDFVDVQTGEERSISEYVWNLPRPMYVPDGATITPSFQHRGLIKNQVAVRMSVSAKSYGLDAPDPEKIFIPYVSSYVSKNFIANDEDTDQSLETDLVNTFPKPLFLQRFTGRTQLFNSATGAVTDLDPTSSLNILSVRMADSNGRAIVPTYTVFGNVFSYATRSWDLDGRAQMDPNAYYRVFLRKTTSPESSYNAADTVQAFVGCVGWREVEDV